MKKVKNYIKTNPLLDLFVSRDISLKLKEIGFNLPCFGIYKYKQIDIYPYSLNEYIIESGLDNYCTAPTYEQVVDWFVNEFGIYIYVATKIKEDGSNETWFIPNGRYIPTKKKNGFEIDPIIYTCKKTKKEAYEFAFKYVIDNIINK